MNVVGRNVKRKDEDDENGEKHARSSPIRIPNTARSLRKGNRFQYVEPFCDDVGVVVQQREQEEHQEKGQQQEQQENGRSSSILNSIFCWCDCFGSATPQDQLQQQLLSGVGVSSLERGQARGRESGQVVCQRESDSYLQPSLASVLQVFASYKDDNSISDVLRTEWQTYSTERHAGGGEGGGRGVSSNSTGGGNNCRGAGRFHEEGGEDKDFTEENSTMMRQKRTRCCATCFRDDVVDRVQIVVLPCCRKTMCARCVNVWIAFCVQKQKLEKPLCLFCSGTWPFVGK